ncbi:helix-turn-helix domain-containing protein [Leifsonia aquatica]|uniref:helix-turn-helix domain-containing protein n=1 Tax=Leifsonia aquatica TaxID=144185 RepID=UPI0035E4636E
MGETSPRQDRYYTVVSTLAVVIQKARHARGLSQEQVAHAAEMSVQTYASLERMPSLSKPCPNPTLHTVMRVLWTLDIDPSDHQ